MEDDTRSIGEEAAAWHTEAASWPLPPTPEELYAEMEAAIAEQVGCQDCGGDCFPTTYTVEEKVYSPEDPWNPTSTGWRKLCFDCKEKRDRAVRERGGIVATATTWEGKIGAARVTLQMVYREG